MRRLVLTASLSLMCIATLLELVFSVRAAEPVAIAMLVIFYGAGQPHFKLRERLLLSAAAILTLVAFILLDNPWPLLERAALQGVFLASFILLLSLLREGASTSNSVLALGAYLTKQPPSRRYLSIFTGGHVLGVILNFGCLSLLGPLIQRGIDAERKDNPAIAAVRERRQISALLRGFSWIIAWSPTAVSQALIPSVIDGVNTLKMAVMGAMIVVAIMVIGWIEDTALGKLARARLSQSGIPRPSAPALPLPIPALRRFVLVCFSLAATATAIVWFFGSRTVPALMLTAPLITAVWLWFQSRRKSDAFTDWSGRMGGIIKHAIPNGSPEALTLSVAGYGGILAAGLISPQWAADALGIAHLPNLAVYIAVMAIIPLVSNLAMPPLFSATFLASLLSSIPGSQLDPTFLGLACICGWAINLTASPFGAATLILSRVTGLKGGDVTWKWNGVFSFMAFCTAASAFILFEAFEF